MLALLLSIAFGIIFILYAIKTVKEKVKETESSMTIMEEGNFCPICSNPIDLVEREIEGEKYLVPEECKVCKTNREETIQLAKEQDEEGYGWGV